MLYNGGPCGQSFNIQPANKFQCFDLISPPGAGPPPLTGPAYIEARASKNGDLFFSGVVGVGEEFNITSGDDRIEADTSILIRQGTSPDGAPMQLINYHTSCSRNLFLKDRYGSTQVAGWINEEQGVVDCIAQDVVYNYDIQSTGSAAEICSLVVFIDPPGQTFDLTDQVVGQIVTPGMPFRVQIPTEIDLTTRQTYRVNATLVGKNPVGTECSDMASISFDAGTPIFGLPPTPGPPTSAPAPTPRPVDGQACEISAGASCLLGNLASCSLLTSIDPVEYTCSLPALIDLGWFFTGTDCAASTTTQPGFVCNDVAPIAGPANIRAVGVTSGNEYFNGAVAPDTSFFMQNVGQAPLDPQIEVTVAGPAGETLQTMTIDTTCTVQNDLTLGKTFGSLVLSQYSNVDDLVEAFAEGSWTYVATNTGTIPLDITEFVTTTNGVTVSQTDPITLGPGEEFTFLVPQLISLIEPGVTYSGSLDTAGLPGPCNASDSETITISPA